MTPEQRLSRALAHFLWMLEPPYTKACWHHCKHRADAMAAKEPSVYADLPRMLEEGLKGLRQSTSTAASTAASARSDR